MGGSTTHMDRHQGYDMPIFFTTDNSSLHFDNGSQDIISDMQLELGQITMYSFVFPNPTTIKI